MADPDDPNRPRLLDDHIGEHLRQSEASGELHAAPSFGKPLRLNDGYDETPAQWRMAMKILRDAGVAPPEVHLLHDPAALRREAAAATEPEQAHRLACKASELEQSIRLRLERYRSSDA
ncbi:MAG TPA: DnaJ family domain-containing protein [Burkholderiaceae bacterium]|nr:DnaJ family domain-containing protein [Burkholderiaceae bacterium]